jgi:hypothetical protein
MAVIPGWSAGPDPESRDSGFDASHRPGMTESGSFRSARNDVKLKSTHDFALATQRARAVDKFFRPRRGRRERRVPAAPAAPCAKVESTGVEATGTPEHPAFPAQWF